MADVRKRTCGGTTRIRITPRVGGVPADYGAPRIPTSKSHAQRARCLSAYLPGDIGIDGMPDAGDLEVLDTALRQPSDAVLQLHDNGTALRILAVLPAMLGERRTLDAGPRLRQRPLAAVEAFLDRYGGSYTEGWPRTFDGAAAVFPDEMEVDARLTTQVATGVLLGAAIRSARRGGSQVVRVRAPAATGYLFVTLEVLGWFGFAAPWWWDAGDLVVEVGAWTAPAPGHRVAIPTDPSSQAFVTAFLAMHGRTSALGPGSDAHPDWRFGDDLTRLLEAPPDQDLVFSELRRRPDTFPCLATMAALRRGRTSFTGIPALRHKESDRIRAMANALTALGVACEEQPDGLRIKGPIEVQDRPVAVPTPADHRVVMAIALLGTRLPGGVEIDNAGAVRKSWPAFFEWLARVSELTWLA